MPDPTAPPSVHTAAATRCPRCGADNRCALTTGAAIERCWCSQGPATLPLPADAAAGCYCARCLQDLHALREIDDAR